MRAAPLSLRCTRCAGFLELFRAYNLRPRRWGRHWASAHQCLSGKPVEDWLAVLGYRPPPR